ncbi:hypothetical protein Spa11_40870 [Botrimarina mediterranea]|uniref:Plasmid stabilization system protein n=1 Tax=Botrimarina mediterranea TaxID=2528022 RepID=A0A518KDI8_9BACT|nr:hypothetical protein Spa11_40870 [Botrimarina mediterranea]
MAYQLRYTATAATELRATTDWIAERAPDTAEQWFEGFVELLATLRLNALAHGRRRRTRWWMSKFGRSLIGQQASESTAPSTP